MSPGIVVSSAGKLTSSVGILGRLLYRFGVVIFTDMYSVTGWVDSAAPPMLFPRIHGMSAREMFG
jgi:hypothetical protein